MKLSTVPFAALSCLACVAAWAGCAAASSSPEPSAPHTAAPDATAGKRYAGELRALNGSLVSGTVRAAVEGDGLSVVVEVQGLEANQLHPQHLHGFFGRDRQATCPTVEADTDGDQVLSAKEAEAVTGPPLRPLEPFPLLSDEGPIRYQETLPVDPDALGPLPLRVVMIHGLTLDGTYQRGLPVACAELRPVHGVTPPQPD